MTGDFETCPVGTMEILKRLEHAGEIGCPICGEDEDRGHFPGCKLAATLKAHRDRMGVEPRVIVSDAIPKDTIAFMQGSEIVGVITDESDELTESSHNCDAMGCGSMDHVIVKIPHPYPAQTKGEG